MESDSEQRENFFTTVTPFSRYIALLLFVVMPFVGFWIGYSYAPTQVVEVTKEVTRDTVAEPISEISQTEPLGESVYEWCIRSGGRDTTQSDFNSFPACIVNNQVFTHKCVSNDKYVVIKDDQKYGIENFVVKSKSSPEQTYDCIYSVDVDDFEIKHDGADRLISLEGDYLLMSSATGPGRAGLAVYDLRTETTVFTGTIVGPASIEDMTLTYWTPTAIEATEDNCNEYVQHEKNGLGSAIDEQMMLNLQTLTTTSLKEIRCSPRQ